jgi:RimJ/RimL family protein N-acetyltransferase
VKIHLETERLILRELTLDDLDALVELDSDPAVLRNINGGVPTSRYEMETDYLPAFMSYYTDPPSFGFWAAIEKATGAFLGWFHFRSFEDADPLRPELGYRLKRSSWGKGYATEGSRALIDKGFTDLEITAVTAMTYGEHTASRRVMEKCGLRLIRTFKPTPEELFKYLGVTDPSIFPGDDVQYAITREEWEAQKRS